MHRKLSEAASDPYLNYLNRVLPSVLATDIMRTVECGQTLR
jgi:hypothetical protein